MRTTSATERRQLRDEVNLRRTDLGPCPHWFSTSPPGHTDWITYRCALGNHHFGPHEERIFRREHEDATRTSHWFKPPLCPWVRETYRDFPDRNSDIELQWCDHSANHEGGHLWLPADKLTSVVGR